MGMVKVYRKRLHPDLLICCFLTPEDMCAARSVWSERPCLCVRPSHSVCHCCQLPKWLSSNARNYQK